MTSRGVVDTSVLVADESGRQLDSDLLPAELSVSVISIGELRAGVLTAGDDLTRARRLDTLTRAQSLDVLPVDADVADAWAQLRMVLRSAGRRMPVNDSWIAATAMALGVPVVTQDSDYVVVDGLEVIHV